MYVVEYEPDQEASDIVKSYRQELLDRKDTKTLYPINISPEEDNKGYLSCIKGFSASSKNADISDDAYFRESVGWDLGWNFDERHLCPKGFNIEIKNKNLSNTTNWIKLATVDISEEGLFYISLEENLPESYDIKISKLENNNGIKIYPKSLDEAKSTPDSLKNMESTGLLKVLRDTNVINLSRPIAKICA